MIYFYARTDNRKDLDRLRRTVALAMEFDEVYLMTTDFRAASYAKSLGIKKAVGIEDFRNISQLAQRGDTLVFDSDEHLENDYVHQEMIDYFGHFVRISYDPTDRRKEGEILVSPYLEGEDVVRGILIDSRYYERVEKEQRRIFFWGDADYEKELLTRAVALEPYKYKLVEGLYFFAGYDDELAPYFEQICEVEEYMECLQSAEHLLAASPQSALEAAVCGASVSYVPKGKNEYDGLLDRFGIERVEWGELEFKAPSGKKIDPAEDPLLAGGAKGVAKILKELI